MRRAEQETIFRFAADEDVVSVFTAHPPTARKLERLGYTPHKTSTRQGEPVSWFYKVPLSEFRWRAGARKRRTRRTVSPEQVARMQTGRRRTQEASVASETMSSDRCDQS
jgi:hypothetical protein